MANHILLIFEGERTEKSVFNSLNKYYLNADKNTILIGIFGTTIYTLYKEINKECYLDLFSLLKEKPQNKELLSKVSRDEVSEIYLFFDYDGHATNAADDKLEEMLSFFTEETENGKLYLSYPMLESLKHLKKDVPFQNIVIESTRDYKKHVNTNCDACYINIPELTAENWKYIISEHCKKLNHLVMGEFCLPKSLISQITIFSHQKEKHILPNKQVAVLCAFPVFIADYYGYEKLPSIIDLT